jgi:hypothetical protein
MPTPDPASRAAQAANNNAAWCDTVCRAHGNPRILQSEIWYTLRPTPRFYPNAVTLDPDGSAVQIPAIQRLIDSGELAGFAVKDSFLNLNLAPLGFDPLFEAVWLWRSESLALPADLPDGIRWETVRDPDELVRWELAWDSRAPEDQLSPEVRIFLPSLLADPDVRFVAGYRDSRIVAGAIGNRSGEIVGLSNVFAPADQAAGYWAGCMREISAAFPGLPMVDYEHGAELDLALSLGFEEIGPLRIWARRA